MPEFDPLVLGLLQIGGVGAPAILLAWLLRRSGCPGGALAAALIGGIIAGLLAGPGVLGRVRPAWYEAVYRGAVAERAALADAIEREQVEDAALKASGVSEEAHAELRHEQAARRAPLEAAARETEARHLQALSLLIAGTCALLAGLGLGSAASHSASTWRRTGDRLISARWRDPGVGVAALVLTATVPALSAWLLGGLEGRSAIGFGVAMAAPGLAVGLRPSTYLACAAGLALAAAAVIIVSWSLGLTIVVAGGVLGLMAGVGTDGRNLRRLRRGAVRAIEAAVLPVAAGLAAVLVDVHAALATPGFLWLLLLATLWSSDGRWLMGRVARGWLSPRESSPWTRSGESVGAGASVWQLIATLGLVWNGMPTHALGAALLGCTIIELSSGARTSLSRALDDGLTAT